jgi:hypothetical protein
MYELRLPLKNEFFTCSVDSFLIKELNKIAIEQGTPLFRNMYDIYDRFVLQNPGDYDLTYPIYDETGMKVIGLGLSTPHCVDCALSGSPEAPPFWEERY